MNQLSQTRKYRRIALVIAILCTVLFSVYLGAVVLAQGVGDPPPATTLGVKVVPWETAGTAVSSTTYYYGPAGGTTGQEVLFWNEAEFFFTASGLVSTQTITLIPQFSADGTNWADAERLSEGWTLPLVNTTILTNASGVTNTTTSTASISFASSAAVRSSGWYTYYRTMTADGTEILRVPIVGQYMRIKATFLTTTVQVTPRIYALLKNKN